MIANLNKENFIYLKDEINTKGVLGITHNRIVEIPNFVDQNTANGMIEYFEYYEKNWGPIAFYNSAGMGIAPNDPNFKKFGLEEMFFEKLRDKFKESVELIFERKVKPNTSHAQKWEVGGFASPHSDNSDFNGEPNAFEINKYVGILYLNDDYEGGELYFCDLDKHMKSYLSFKPNKFSYYVFPGGVENIHGVSEIKKGTRYTMVSFWDYEESEYDEQKKARWEEEEKEIRIQQANQRELWEKGIV